jgi:ribonuclease HI
MTEETKKPETEIPEKESLDFIVYTDGGAKPSRGRAGYGFHGYLYRDSVPKQGSGAKATPTNEGYVASAPKDKAVEVVTYVDMYASMEANETNNAMELIAACEALEYASEKNVKSILVYVDSKYVGDGLTDWVAGWMANDWKKSDGGDVVNRELWERLLLAKGALEKKQISVNIQWVRGHSGDLGNTMADFHASRGVLLAEKRVVDRQRWESESKGYWNLKSAYNRMLSKSCWYFNTNTGDTFKTADGRWVYHLGKHGDNDGMLGKRMSDASFSVVYLKEPSAVLEILRTYQDEVSDGTSQRVIVGRLDAIHQPRNHLDLQENKDRFLSRGSRHLDLTNIEDVQLTKEMRPARLAYRAIETLVSLEAMLEDYVFGKDGDPQRLNFVVTDITDLLFEKEETSKGKVKCKLKKELGTGVRSIDADIEYDTGKHKGTTTTTLVLDMDLPNRNALSALADRNPTVKVLTVRESDGSFRFASVMEAGDDIGIWSSIYSNLKLISGSE